MKILQRQFRTVIDRCSQFWSSNTSTSGVRSLALTLARWQRNKSGVQAVELTSVRFPHVKRSSKYSTLTDKDVRVFENLLPGQGRVLTEQTDVEGYNVDWLKTVRGASSLVLRPKTTEEVAEILKYCNEQKLAVCPQGGNTGLVGGSVPVFDEIVLSTQLMNNIIHLDEVSGVLVCQSGCVLEALDDYLADYDLVMPLDLGAKGSCHIGGNVSTNAGGIRLLRYGSLHGTVLGLEAVLANGEVLDSLSRHRKDNTGYDVKQLFIGSEGTLGIVTKVAILCPQRPKSVKLAFLGLESYTRVLETLKEAKKDLGEILSAFEFMDEECMNALTENLGLKNPVQDCPYYCLIETSGSNSDHDESKLNTFLETHMNNNTFLDGTLATETSKIKALWFLRENLAKALLADGYVFSYDVSLPIQLVPAVAEEMKVHLTDAPEALVSVFGHIGDGRMFSLQSLWQFRERIAEGILHDGHNFKYDVSLPVAEFPAIVSATKERLQGRFRRVVGYGHVGDGNLHLNVTVPEYSKEVASLIEPFVYEWVSQHKGSISAEHGIGFHKSSYIGYSKSAAALKLMQQLKATMDPNSILNPYKTISQ